MNKTDTGDQFVTAIVKLAQQQQIAPGHAIECFGKIAAMLTQFEKMRGGIQSTEEGLEFVMTAFAAGLATVYPVVSTHKVTRVKDNGTKH